MPSSSSSSDHPTATTTNGESCEVKYEAEIVGGNKSTVESLYEALGTGDAQTVSALLAADLEWWFHGPPSCQYMMRVLTGACDHRTFSFLPQNVTAIGSMVFAEGWEDDGENVYWVHVWTVQDGVITRVREYFNTWITVRDLRPLCTLRSGREATTRCVWKSGHAGHCNGRSLPGLVVAI